MITNKSRYASGRLVREGSTIAVQRVFRTPAPARFKVHHWSQADRLDILAARMFGDPTAWWRILDLNPLVQSPSDLRPGMVIRIPDA